MEGDCSQLDFVLGEGFDFEDPLRDIYPNALNLEQNQNQTMMVTSQDCVQNLSITDYNNVEKTSEDNGNESKKNSPWQRVKWMDQMVKLMITALSYIGENSGSSNVYGKKGKWKLVSKAMEERGYRVSPQQCEDKFNELNKRYKKLNELLGRGTSCNVVENPALLDKIYYLNEKEKDEVRKIMSSKHLFYEEMCSYINGNRLHLPHDIALQQSLHLMVTSCDDGDLGGPSKRLRKSPSLEDFINPNVMSRRECDNGYVPNLPLPQTDLSQGMSLENGKDTIESKTLELEKQKLQIQAEMMELKRQRFKWEMFSKKKDRELEKMRMHIEKSKLENERMTLELKQAELDARSLQLKN